jgi:ankyrin repeat protein
MCSRRPTSTRLTAVGGPRFITWPSGAMRIASGWGYPFVSAFCFTDLYGRGRCFSQLVQTPMSSQGSTIHLCVSAKCNVHAMRASRCVSYLECSPSLNFKKQALLLAPSNLTPLCIAAARGFVASVHFLIAARSKINWRAKNGATALTFAVEQGHDVCTEMLLDAGASLAPLVVRRGFRIFARLARH